MVGSGSSAGLSISMTMPPLRSVDLVLDGRRGRDELELELALQSLLHDLQVQQSEEAAAETEAERRGVFGLVRKRGVVQLQLLERLLEVRELVGVGREKGRRRPSA